MAYQSVVFQVSGTHELPYWICAFFCGLKKWLCLNNVTNARSGTQRVNTASTKALPLDTILSLFDWALNPVLPGTGQLYFNMKNLNLTPSYINYERRQREAKLQRKFSHAAIHLSGNLMTY